MLGWEVHRSPHGGHSRAGRTSTMGFMDKAKDAFGKHDDKVADAVDQHSDRIDQGIDRGTEFADERTGGKYGEHIDKGGDAVRDHLDGLDGKQDDFGGNAGSDADKA
ncbi:antitoxin [Ornithinimicrobium kibberense]